MTTAMQPLIVLLGSMLALSPWEAPAFDPTTVERHRMQQCFENDDRSHEVATPTPTGSTPSPAADTVRPAQIDRGPTPAALIATGVALLAAGSAMRVPSPMFMEIQPPGDPSGRGVTAGITSYTHRPHQVALGTVGTVLQAVGVGVLQRGIERHRAR